MQTQFSRSHLQAIQANKQKSIPGQRQRNTANEKANKDRK